MTESLKLLTRLATCCLTMILPVHGQTSGGPKDFHSILGAAGITKSQFLNGAIEDKSAQGSIASAERWYEQAAAHGHEGALGNLAMLKYCGDRRPLDMAQAFALLKNLSDRGSSEAGAVAPWLIGIAYFFGDSVPQDYAKSIPWLELSGRRANPYAIHLLLKIYAEGLGTQASEEKVLWWLQFAADHGDKNSQIQLADRLAKSGGGSKNLVASYFWYLSARKDGAAVAPEQIGAVERKIDPEDAATIKQGVDRSGLFRWTDWDRSSLAGAWTFPCQRHLNNPLLGQLHLSYTP